VNLFKITFLIIFLSFISNISVAISQDNEDPFVDFEKEVEKTEKSKPQSPKKAKTKNSDRNIKNPKTYLLARNYILKGVVMSPSGSFAIVGTEKTQDLVVSLGEKLGKEGWEVMEISSDFIVVGDFKNKNKQTKLFITD